MKKFLSLILTVIFLVLAAGCNQNNPIDGDKSPSGTTSDTTASAVDEGEFHMISNSNSITSFAIIADAHIGKDEVFADTLGKTVEWINKNDNIKFVLYTGDNINNGYYHIPNNKEVSLFQQINSNLSVPYYAIRGNHDPAVNEFERNTYIECGDVVVIGFYAEFYVKNQAEFPKNNGYVYPEDLAWIEKALERARGKRVILSCHHSIVESFSYPICAAGPVPEKNLDWVDFGREKILDLAEKNDIELYFNGHEHYRDAKMGTAGCLTDYSLPALGEQRQFTVVTVSPDKAVIEIRDARRGDEVEKSYEYKFVK